MKKLIAILVAISMIMGFALVANAAEIEYGTGLQLVDSWWGIQKWYDAASGTVAGPGTYTMTYEGTTEGHGFAFLLVAVWNAGSDYSSRLEVSSVSVIADETELTVDMAKVSTYADENGNFIIDLSESVTDDVAYTKITVSYTLSEKSSDDVTPPSDGDSGDEKTEDTTSGYKAYLGFTAAGWWPTSWDTISTAVDGAGTYTLSWDTSNVSGVITFVIDIGEVGGDAAEVLGALELSDVSIAVDGEEIDVDLSKIATGDLENDGQYRIEIYNEYSPSKDAPAVDPADLVVNSNLTVTFTLSVPDSDDGDGDATTGSDNTGDTSDDKQDESASTDDKQDESTSSDDKQDESTSSDDKQDETKAPVAAMNHTAGLSYADADWYPQTWGETAYVTVTGAGTYTLSWDLADAVEGVVVFVIDIGEVGGTAAADIAELGLTALTLSVDGVDVPVDLSKVVTGDVEADGQYRIEIYNEYGTTKDNAPVDVSLLNASKNITVNFTLGNVADSSNSKTGDSTNLIALAAAMILAVTGITAIIVSKKKFF